MTIATTHKEQKPADATDSEERRRTDGTKGISLTPANRQNNANNEYKQINTGANTEVLLPPGAGTN